MAQCSFGRVATNGVWQAQYPFGTDLDGRFLYLRAGDRQWLLAAFDFSYQFRRTSLRWRQAVAAATGIPLENIWVHELQNHSAPCAPDLDGEPCERLIARCLPAIREMMGRAEEAEMAYVLADLGDRFNMNREQYIPGLGAVTVWGGFEYDATGRPYTQDPDLMLLAGWRPDLPAFRERIYFDRPADPQGAVLAFRGRDGKMLGTLARFAAHADIVGACWDRGGADPASYRYHFDWPGFLRQRLERQFGGVGIAVCGPCGNLSPKKVVKPGYEWGVAEARRIGAGVGDALLAAWEDSPPAWAPLSLGNCANASVAAPLRPEFPRSHAEMAEQAPRRAEEFRKAYQDAIAAGAPAYRVKQLIDAYWHWSWVPKIVDRWAGLSDDELAGRSLRAEVAAVRINDLLLAGLPGESMTETCLWLRAQTIGRRLIVVDQVNGYCAYQTTREQFDLGAYSYACSCLAREAESLTRSQALEVIRRVGGSIG